VFWRSAKNYKIQVPDADGKVGIKPTVAVMNHVLRALVYHGVVQVQQQPDNFTVTDDICASPQSPPRPSRSCPPRTALSPGALILLSCFVFACSQGPLVDAGHPCAR
jgi:hypothetical protein